MKDPNVVSESLINKRQGAYLPHWTREGAIYAVTFRLADSLPQVVLQTWLKERTEIVNRAKQMQRELSIAEVKLLQELYSEQVESYLDAGHGSCWLQKQSCAELVANALNHFDGQRYKLHAWCVMPNHVHVIVDPIGSHKLSDILHSWKSFTATAANRLLRRTGTFWQEEYYDHLIRDADDYLHSLNYLLKNPEAAGLINWPWVWCRGTDNLSIT